VGDLSTALAILRAGRFVDLTHAFNPSIPHCDSFEPEQRRILYHYDAGVGALGHGFLAHEYRHVGQWGTHCDPPNHFVRGGLSLDEIPVDQMIAPLVILDIASRAARDPDCVADLNDLAAWEGRNGRVPEGAFVALHTGWGSYWPDSRAMANRDGNGTQHFPGWSAELLHRLAHEREVVAIGHDTTDTDPGIVVSRRQAPLEDFWLRQGKWQIELLGNLDKVPEAGALIVASWPKPEGGSGFPARCFAVCPPEAAAAEAAF
jgi:kynurenine formamidase